MVRNSRSAPVSKLGTKPVTPRVFEAENGGAATVEHADAMACYSKWPQPTAIVSDGPYGLGKYPGEPGTPDALAEAYAPHVAEWARRSLPGTTLWFWCSEVGWAEVHGVLKTHGWRYKAAHIWDKGLGHVAGNSNGDTIRGLPVVTEICVQYVRDAKLPSEDGELLPLKEWLRQEWQRSGLPLYRTNEACGVKNAATRKYFTQCDLWYFPPADKMVALAAYAKQHGIKSKRPYFSLDGKTSLTQRQWSDMRAKWNHVYGVTNVWNEPAVRGQERLKSNGLKAVHINQKPLRLMDQIISVSTDEGDVVWEPFGGLCSASVAAMRRGRQAFASEVIPEFYLAAVQRLDLEQREINGSQSSASSARSNRTGR